MTLDELIDEAKGGNYFPVLYHRNADQLEALARRSLGFYQDRLGYHKRVDGDVGANTIALPADFLSVISVVDSRGFSQIFEVSGASLVVTEDPFESVGPYILTYAAKLRNLALTDQVPDEAVDVLIQHLVAQIAIPNTQRERGVAQATAQQVELPSDQELRDRLKTLEEDLFETRCWLPPLIS